MENNFLSSYLDRLETLHKQLCEEIEGLPVEAMDWEPGQDMNSIAVLLAHTAGSLRYWIGDVALGEPSQRDREREFQTRGVASQEMQARLDAAFEYLRGGVPRLHMADLGKEGYARRGGESVSRGWALLHALEHGFLHLGHIQLTRQLWKARSAGN